jgi:hypothetical protein
MALLHRWLFLQMGLWSCTDAVRPDFLIGGGDWLHRCRHTGTTSQHLLPEASSKFDGPYWGLCWHTSDLLTVHHVVRSESRSLWPDEELSGPLFIFRRQIPGGALGCPSSQRGTFIGPSNYLTWNWGRRYLTILVLTSSNMSHIYWTFSCSVLNGAGSLPAPEIAARARLSLTSVLDSTLWQWVQSSWHDRRKRSSALFSFRHLRCSEVKSNCKH